FHLHLLGGAAGIGRGDGEQQPSVAQRQLDRAAALTRYGRDAVHRLLEFLLVDDELLVVAGRNHTAVVREGAVDELGRENHVAEREANLARRQFHGDLGLVVLDQALDLADGLARHDDAGYPGGALRQRQLHLCQPVAVGRNRAQRRRLRAAGGVEIDAVEVVACLLGRDRKL